MNLCAILQLCVSLLLIVVAPSACTPELAGLDVQEETEQQTNARTSSGVDAGFGSEADSGSTRSAPGNTNFTETVLSSDAATPPSDAGSNTLVPDASVAEPASSQSSPDAAGATGDAATTGAEDQISIVASSPLSGDSAVAVDVPLRLTFDRPVVAKSGWIRLITEDGMDIAFELDASDADVLVDGTQVSIPWGITLGYATWYWIEIAADAFVGTDGAGFPGLTGDTLRFRTEEPPPIELQATFPEGNTPAELEPTLTLVFNVDVVSATTGELIIYEVDTDEEVGRVAISDATQVHFEGGRVDINMGLELSYGTAYYVLLEEGSIVSTRGAVFEGIDEPETFTFVTVDPPALVITQSSPVQVDIAASGVGLSPAFVFTFSEPIVAGAGAFEVRLTTDDTLVEEVTVGSVAVSIQGATLTIALPSTLAADTGYYLLLDPGLVAGTAGGVFEGIQAADALVFTTADLGLPNVELTGTTPIVSAVGVAVDTSLSFTFDVPVEANQGSVSLHEAESGDTIVEIDIASGNVAFTDNTVNVNLSTTLPGSTEIEVRISPGAIVGANGAPFAGLSGSDYTFQTESSFGVVTLSPFEIEAVDPATNLVLNFSSAVAVGTGTIQVRDSGGVIESISLPDARVTVSGTEALIDLDNILAGGASFEVRVEAGAFVEAGGNGEMLGIGSGDWTFGTATVDAPAGIGSGLILWLDAAYAPSLKGTNVFVWADRSGQYRNVVQADSARRPALVESSMNSRSVVRFDGNDDVLRGLELINSSNLDGFIVWRSATVPSDSSQRTILANDAVFELNHSHPYAPSSLASCVGNQCPESQWYSALFQPVAAINVTQVWSFGYSSSDTLIYARANAGATETQTGPSAPPAAATTPLHVGGEPANCGEGCYFAGDIAEVLLYSTPLSGDQKLDVLEYLYDKWQVASGSCGAGEVRGPSGKCYVYDTASRLWQASQDYCRSRGIGWELAEVRNELDHRFLLEMLYGTSANVWLGAQVANGVDTWRWLSDNTAFWTGRSLGTPVAGLFTNWRSDQPNNGGSSVLCLRYRFENDTWGWSDADCAIDTGTAICQGPAD